MTVFKDTKIAHWCYISPRCAFSQHIAMQYGTLIKLMYIINMANFGCDRSQGWGLMSSQILGFCIFPRSTA